MKGYTLKNAAAKVMPRVSGIKTDEAAACGTAPPRSALSAKVRHEQETATPNRRVFKLFPKEYVKGVILHITPLEKNIAKPVETKTAGQSGPAINV